MAEVAEGAPSLATPAPPHNSRLSDPLVAGEVLEKGRACCIRTNGLVYMADGSADDAEALVHGWTARKYFAGNPVTLYFEVNFEYGSGLTPGAPLYLSATLVGRLNTVATTGGKVPVAFVVSPDKIRVLRTVERQTVGP